MHDQVINILSKKWVIPAAVGVTSFGSGLVAGYFWGKRNGDIFELNLEDITEIYDDKDQLKFDFDQVDDYIPMHTVTWNQHKASPIGFVYFERSEDGQMLDWDSDEEAEWVLEEDELEEAVEEQMHLELVTNDGDNTPEIVNVFDNRLDDDQWNYEDELSIRTPDAPYVISVDEFVADEAGCDQATVTYYVGDDIMADEFDVPMYGFNEMMGDLKFGHGSNDSTVVYIRNEKLEMEWEVLQHSGRFDIEVLGHDVEDAYEKAELKHSVPRFREE